MLIMLCAYFLVAHWLACIWYTIGEYEVKSYVSFGVPEATGSDRMIVFEFRRVTTCGRETNKIYCVLCTRDQMCRRFHYSTEQKFEDSPHNLTDTILQMTNPIGTRGWLIKLSVEVNTTYNYSLQGVAAAPALLGGPGKSTCYITG